MNRRGGVALRAHRGSAAALASLVLLCSSAAGQEGIPRYEFRAGDAFLYEGKLEQVSLSDGSAATRPRVVTLTCLESDPRRAILLLETESAEARGASSVDGEVLRRGVLLEIHERGEAVLLPEFAARTEGIEWALALVPDLPSSVRLLDPWTTPADLLGRRWNCRLSGPDAEFHDHLRLERQLVANDCVATMTSESLDGACWFNPRQQVLTRAQQHWTYPKAQTRVSVDLELRGIQRRNESWIQTRRFEAERFRARLRSEDRLIGEVVSAARPPDQLVADFQRNWNEFLKELGREDTPFRAMANVQGWDAARLETLHREQAELARRWMSHPAAGWTLQSPDGTTHSSEAVRGRRTLEFFWTLNSRECLRMFDTLHALAERFPPPRLAMVCLNVDSEYTQASQAIETCGQGLLHVLSGPPVGGELPSQLPVIRLLDENNRVVRMAFGYQPALQELVEPLLEPLEPETKRP